MDERRRLREQLLVLRFQSGDRAVFDELYRAHRAPVRFVVEEILGRSTVADDVEQEAWTTAFEKLHRLRDPGALAAWLRQIARRLALRERRRSRRWRGSTEEPRERESSIETDPRWASSDVRAALQRLSDDHREILELRYLRELEYEEIVRELGCPIGTVRSRLHYARLALRRVMEGSDHVD